MKWKTKDGQLLELKDMDDRHLTNAIRMTRQNIKEKPLQKYQQALVELLKERHRRDEFSFMDFNEVMDEELKFGPKVKAKKQVTFMDLLGEL